MGKIASALGLDAELGEESSDPMSAMEPMDSEMAEEKPEGSSSAEVLAMKQFDRATSPEAKAQAMKDFLEACGMY